MSSDMEGDRRSVLAIIGQLRGQLRESLVLSARDEEEAQAVAAGLRDAKAANTRRGLRLRMARVQRMGPRKWPSIIARRTPDSRPLPRPLGS